MSKRKTSSFLPFMDAAPIIAADPKLRSLDKRLKWDGWKRKPFVRPYLSNQHKVTIRFIWKRRRKGWHETHELTVRMRRDRLEKAA